MQYETENVEFKRSFTEEIYKEVIAFANTDGGILFIGIDNDGNAVGLTDVDAEYTRITNGIRDAIMPDVTMCVKYTIQDNKVVRIVVNEGTNKPYYLKSKGLKPNGVFVRQGTSSVQASPEKIRQMIKESDGDNFEDGRALEQRLTFNAARSFFAKYGVEFSEEKYFALGMTQKNSCIYTNLALLLADQCPYTTKIAVFDDEFCTVFRDSKEFGGSIFEQFEQGIQYLALCNRTVSEIKGVERIDKPDYPEEAIREAFLNALIHRDYGFSGSIIINVNDNKMEFISLGGLLNGLSKEDICLGISQPRNKHLAEIFHRLRLIESYGTGIRRIYRLYENCPVKPDIETAANAFKMVLPNMNAGAIANSDKLVSATEQMKAVLAYLQKNGAIRDEEICSLLNIKKSRVYKLAKQMREMALIKVEGRGAGKKYYLQ